MQRVANDTGATPDGSNAHFREQADDPKRDDTTLEFDGLMKVSPDDAGSDPYNRTGKFKRLVR